MVARAPLIQSPSRDHRTLAAGPHPARSSPLPLSRPPFWQMLQRPCFSPKTWGHAGIAPEIPDQDKLTRLRLHPLASSRKRWFARGTEPAFNPGSCPHHRTGGHAINNRQHGQGVRYARAGRTGQAPSCNQAHGDFHHAGRCPAAGSPPYPPFQPSSPPCARRVGDRDHSEPITRRLGNQPPACFSHADRSPVGLHPFPLFGPLHLSLPLESFFPPPAKAFSTVRTIKIAGRNPPPGLSIRKPYPYSVFPRLAQPWHACCSLPGVRVREPRERQWAKSRPCAKSG